MKDLFASPSVKKCQSKTSCYKRLQPSRNRSGRWRGVGEASCRRLACQGGLMQLGRVGRLGPLLVQCWLGSWRRRLVWGPWFPVGRGLNFQVWEPHTFGPDARYVMFQVLGSESDVNCCHGGEKSWMGLKELSQLTSCPQWKENRIKAAEYPLKIKR